MVAVVVLAIAGQFAGVYSGSGASVAMFLAVYTAGDYSDHKRRDLSRGLLVGAVMAVLLHLRDQVQAVVWAHENGVV